MMKLIWWCPKKYAACFFSNLNQPNSAVLTGNFVRQKCRYWLDVLCQHTFQDTTEQNIGDWRIAHSAQGVDDLAALSDGLCGELYTEDGWIARHSEYPPLEAVLAAAMAQENGDKAA